MWSLDNRLHDFGFRGCTSIEQSIIGGVAHLVNYLMTSRSILAVPIPYLRHGMRNTS